MRDLLTVLPILAIGAFGIALVHRRRVNAELRRQGALRRLRFLAGDIGKRETAA